MGLHLVHYEIAGRDGEKLERFYSGLFGWEIERKKAGGYPYGQIAAAQEGAPSGGIRHEPEGKPEIVLYIGVPDVEAALEKARKLGAAVRIPVMRTPDVTFALITDPEGNPIGLVQEH